MQESRLIRERLIAGRDADDRFDDQLRVASLQQYQSGEVDPSEADLALGTAIRNSQGEIVWLLDQDMPEGDLVPGRYSCTD